MSTIWFLARNIIRVTFRRKSSYLIYFFLPLLGLLVSVVMYSGLDSSPLRIGIVDLDNSQFSRELSEHIGDGDGFEITHIGLESINDLLIDGELSSVLLYPETWSESLFSSRPTELEIISLRGAETTAWLETYVDMYLENLYIIAKTTDGDREMFDQLYKGYKEQELRLISEKVEDETEDMMVTLQSLGFLLLFMMLGTSNSSELILREKRSRTYFRICSAPVKPRSYVISNLVANFVIVCFQVLAVTALMKWVFRINTHIASWQLMVILLFYGLVAIGLGMIIAAFSKTSYQASTMATLIITPSCMLGGCFWSANLMPDFMKGLSYFMPQRWALLAIEKLQAGATFGETLINITVLMAFAITLFAVSAYKFKISDDVTRFV